MIKKWKYIIRNWINCYVTESVEKDHSIKPETLINIITHLRENLNLDESKSSVLEAQTVSEFILEKYPEFKFKNGTTEASTDNDLYFAASLLLFFVCVNSKDIDIKSAMCNLLSSEDQKTILKFSKNLMECSFITHKDVHSAIQEACGQDVAAAEPVQHQSVAETPPPLRTLHGEVRRLQAALDAERFDRTYLQDELSRSHLKLEKLLKDKEQYKLEILNLKAKISLTTTENDELNSQTSENNSSKLMRQMQCLEERLAQTLEQIDELQFERDTLKSKVEDLRKERDKWLQLGQESVARVDQLLEELESERRQVQSYKELVSELRTHNQRNGLDSSQLECDDPDSSMRSLLQNTSVCSEACANVVEVQLIEERAKIVDLKQQLQTLQQEILDLTYKADADKQKYEEQLSEKDEYIMNLKHKINEEIEEKTLVSTNLNEEITKLNNEINELEQKFKEHKEISRQTIEGKMEEITTLQKEKMCLLQSLSNETTKLETNIQELLNDLVTERASKKSMCEQYDKQIMQLNEKVLNRNNELVELQNNVFDKSEKIESMRVALEMRESHLQSLMEQVTCVEADLSELQNKLDDEQNNKRRLREEYENKLMKMNEKVLNRNNELVELQNNIFQKSEQIETMRVLLENKTTELNNLTSTNEQLKDKQEKLQQQYQTDVSSKDKNIVDLERQIETLKEDISNKNIKMNEQNSECTQLKAKIVQLNQDLKEEKDTKQKRFAELQHKITSLNKKLTSKSADVETLKVQIAAKVDNIKNLVEEKKAQSKLLTDLGNEVASLKKELAFKINDLKLIHEQFETEKKSKIKAFEEYEKTVINHRSSIDELNMVAEKLRCDIEDVNQQLEQEKKEKDKVKNELQNDIAQLKNEVSSRSQECDIFGKELKAKTEIIDDLNKDINKLNEYMTELTYKLHKIETKNIQLSQKIKKNKMTSAADKKSQDDKIYDLHKTITDLDNEVKHLQNCSLEKTKNVELLQEDLNNNKILLEDSLKKVDDSECRLKILLKEIQDKENSAQCLKENFEKTISELNDKILEYEAEQQVLKNVVTVTESIMGDQKETIEAANKEIIELRERHQSVLVSCEEEKTILQQIIEEKDVLCKEKTKLLQTAQKSEQTLLEDISLLNKEKNTYVAEIKQLKSQINSAESEISNLQDKLAETNTELEDIRILNKKNTESCEVQKNMLLQTLNERECKLNEEIMILQTELQNKSAETQNLVAQIENVEYIFRNKIHSLEDHYNKETQSLINKLVNLDNVKEKLQSTLNYHNVELKNLRIELEEREIEIKKINEENYSLNCELKEKQEDLLKLAYEKETLLEIKTIIEDEKTRLLEESKILKDQVENEKQEKNKYVEDISVQLSTVENEKEKLSFEIESLHKDLIDSKKEVELKDRHIENMSVQQRDLEEMFKKLHESYDILRIDSENKIQTLTSEYKRLQENHHNKIEEMKKVISDLTADLENHIEKTKELDKAFLEKESKEKCLQSEIQELQKSKQELVLNTSNLESELATSETKRQEIDKCNESLQREKDKYVAMVEELGSELLQKDKKVSKLKDANKTLTNLVEENKTTIDTLTAKVTKFEDQCAQLLTENQVLIEKCSKLETSSNQVISELEQRKLEVETLQTVLKNNQGELTNLHSEFQKLTETLNEKEIIIEKFHQEKHSLDDNLTKEIEEKIKLQEEKAKELSEIKDMFKNIESELRQKIIDKDELNTKLNEECNKTANEKNKLQDLSKELKQQIETLKDDVNSKGDHIQIITKQNEDKDKVIDELKKDLTDLQSSNNEIKIMKDTLENEIKDKNNLITDREGTIHECNNKILHLEDKLLAVDEEKLRLETERDNLKEIIHKANLKIDVLNEKIQAIEVENNKYAAIILENKTVITNLEQLIKHELEQNQHIREESNKEKLDLTIKCTELQGHRTKVEKDLEDKQNELQQLNEIIASNNNELALLRHTVDKLTTEFEACSQELKIKESVILKLTQDKDSVIGAMSKELLEEKEARDKFQKELESKAAIVYELRQKIEGLRNDDVLRDLRKENDELIKAIGHRETVAAVSVEKSPSRKSTQSEKIARMFFQVDTSSPTDNSHTSNDSYKTITDLEKILYDKNKTIMTLQSDITYLKTLIADSENKLLDTVKELDTAKENGERLSIQLKKIVNQKNEEIAELKKHVNKMSVTENRATEIIKLSAKYQTIILKRIAEIKSNTALKELTNFGNCINGDNELRRGIQAGNVTMDDLENFLDTTDRHLKRCSEKMTGLQKERDRLYEVARINEAEIIGMRKFLADLAGSYQTFNSVREQYVQRLSRVATLQRSLRQQLPTGDKPSHVTLAHDLADAVLAAQRWAERCLARTMSVERIQQAFTSELDRATNYHDAALEAQIDHLEKSLQRLQTETTQQWTPPDLTVGEVRAEYEDKLNRMKAKMKQLYQEQISVYKEKQKEEVAELHKDLQRAKEKLSESSRAYEEHIRALTAELWAVGEKFLVQQDEAQWLRRQQRPGSLMSLQHVHSSGLLLEEPPLPSDSASLRSLPVCSSATNMRERESLSHHRECEPASTPGRLRELRRRNSLCPPHLRSLYPAETQFAPALDEDHIKCTTGRESVVSRDSVSSRPHRKEVGITAYKKPGPPTPSKQAGRLSATDSELRESMRVEADPQLSRKTASPSRLRSLFRSSRHEASEMTPRKRLSNIFRKK